MPSQAKNKLRNKEPKPKGKHRRNVATHVAALANNKKMVQTQPGTLYRG